MLFNLENGSFCGWALVTKERKGGQGHSDNGNGNGIAAHSWVPMRAESGEDGRALAWPLTQCVWCCKMTASSPASVVPRLWADAMT